jgi:hypothetical protein
VRAGRLRKRQYIHHKEETGEKRGREEREEREKERERRNNPPISRSQTPNSHMSRWKRAIGMFPPVRLRMTLVDGW